MHEEDAFALPAPFGPVFFSIMHIDAGNCGILPFRNNSINLNDAHDRL
jgi:hypothetical protein